MTPVAEAVERLLALAPSPGPRTGQQIAALLNLTYRPREELQAAS